MTNWKLKLAAYLHDPPSKALEIANHEEHARVLYRQAGFSEDEILHFTKAADWTASAADRFPFPASQAGGLRCEFEGVRNAFHHPLGPPKGSTEVLRLPFKGPFLTSDLARETDQSVQPVVDDFGSLPDDDSDQNGQRWRARFFAHWRLWPKFARERDYRFAFLPADTRMPDHTVWTHMQVVSALQACAEGEGKAGVIKAAFFKLQIGPVQEFIAQARSTRDLWSGSYLLSWLMAAGLKALTARVGPDAVIYPSLRSQPLFDLHWRQLWTELRLHKDAKSAWETLDHNNTDLLTPNLPNVMFAVVPQEDAKDLARYVETAIRDEWRTVADACWNHCEAAGMTADEPGISAKARRERFNVQVERFISISWQVTHWPSTLEGALELAKNLPIDQTRSNNDPRQRIQAVIDAATKEMPKEHRDRRYYEDAAKTKLNSLGLGWSVLYAFNSWALDAVRETRPFEAWTSGGWYHGVFNNKDSLNGRDEAVAGGRKWQRRAEKKGNHWTSLFKKDDWLGATTLIKRLWHLAYLKPKWGLDADSRRFPMPNTRGIAAHDPFSNAEDEQDPEDIASSDKYFAVLALDGDEIGKWISGDKAPGFESQFASYTDGSGNPEGALRYFKKYLPNLTPQQRPVSPSYHLQFSEALTNFALECAHPIVEAFDGRMIYSGGDDALALLPADTALACAQALRLAFQGSPELGSYLAKNAEVLQKEHERNKRDVPHWQKLAAEKRLLETEQSGFLKRLDRVDSEGNRPIPSILPGPAADVSIGIAIAHFKSPLQDVIRAARLAQKRAKNELGRSAVNVTLLKRSGETIEWGCKWDDGGLDLYQEIASALKNEELSAKFPYRLAELLVPYLVESAPLAGKALANVPDFPVDDVVEIEFFNTLERQRGKARPEFSKLSERMRPHLKAYVASLNRVGKGTKIQDKIKSFLGLCQTVAFANRTNA